MAAPSPHSELVERGRALAPLIAENAERAEQERKPVDSVITRIEQLAPT